MSDLETLYAELKPDVQALAGALFDATAPLVRKNGTFLPHGATLAENGEVRMVMAAPPDFETKAVSSVEVLPLLHEALQFAGRQADVKAVAVCEEVTISTEARGRTTAVKVLFEHRRGLCVALYMPYRRKLFGGYRFDPILMKPADPEVRPWEGADA